MHVFKTSMCLTIIVEITELRGIGTICRVATQRETLMIAVENAGVEIVLLIFGALLC